MSAVSARDRVIVALDVPDVTALAAYLDRLEGQPTFYKVGLELFVAAGPRAVELVRARGGRVFLDLKLHDIPETVARAVASAAALGVELLTIHTAGGAEMMKRAAEAAAAAGTGLRILGVTVLTSLSADDLAADGVGGTVVDAVVRRARLAAGAGIGGLVCSPQEVEAARAAAPALLRVVPGVRPAGAALGDQKRVATPAATLRVGADHLVVGRPIRDAASPVEAFAAIVREIECRVTESRSRAVFGVRPVDEIVRARPRDVAVVYVADGHKAGEIDRTIAAAKDRGIAVEFRPRALVAGLAGKGATHQGIVALVGEYPYATADQILEAAVASGTPPLIMLLDGVTDPHNLGAVVRSAEVLGGHGVIIPERNAAPVTGSAVKASAGATERVPVARVGNLLKTIDFLREQQVQVFGTSADDGTPLHETELTGAIAFVLGSEGEGTREAVLRRCDGLVRIPQRGQVASLNVSVAGAILLYEAMRQRAASVPAAE